MSAIAHQVSDQCVLDIEDRVRAVVDFHTALQLGDAAALALRHPGPHLVQNFTGPLDQLLGQRSPIDSLWGHGRGEMSVGSARFLSDPR